MYRCKLWKANGLVLLDRLCDMSHYRFMSMNTVGRHLLDILSW